MAEPAAAPASAPARQGGAGHPGGPNRSTIERQLLAQQQIDEARKKGSSQPLAREVLEEMMNIARGAMAQFQYVSEEMIKRAAAEGRTLNKNEQASWPQFGEWFDRTVFVAKELAKYQSPQLKAIMVAPPPDPNMGRNRIKRFTLKVFDARNPMPADDAQIVEQPKSEPEVLPPEME